MKKYAKAIPNVITSIRIIGAIVMIFLEPLTAGFFIVYGLCGASDALDGFLARKLQVSSKFGSILDSVSDLIFYTIMAVKMFPVFRDSFIPFDWAVILVPVGFQIIGYLICLIKFKKFSALHTYGNKVLSIAVFFFPFTFIGNISLLYHLYLYIFGVEALYASTEVCLIHLLSKEYDERNKTIFFLKRNKETING